MIESKIAPIGLPAGLPQINPIQTEPATGLKPGEASFGQWLESSLSEVTRLRQDAAGAEEKLITGESKDIHNTMIAMQKASIAMDLMIEVRNKVIAAYEEVKRMQI